MPGSLPTRTYGPFTGGTSAVGTQVDTDLNTLYTLLQGNLGNVHLAADAGIVQSKLATFDKVRVTNTAAQTLTTGVAAALTFDTETYDTNGLHSTASNTSRLTCVTAGYYHIYGAVRWGTESAASYTEIVLKLNNTTNLLANDAIGSAAVNIVQTVSLVYLMAAGDYVELIAQQASGGNKTVTAAFTQFGMTLVA